MLLRDADRFYYDTHSQDWQLSPCTGAAIAGQLLVSTPTISMHFNTALAHEDTFPVVRREQHEV